MKILFTRIILTESYESSIFIISAEINFSISARDFSVFLEGFPDENRHYKYCLFYFPFDLLNLFILFSKISSFKATNKKKSKRTGVSNPSPPPRVVVNTFKVNK